MQALSEAVRERAESLATALDLPLAAPSAGDPPRLYLQVSASGLALAWSDQPQRGRLRLDLAPPRSSRPSPQLLRALGLDRGVRRVVDATAGLGRDAARIAMRAAEVTMIEQHPVLAALLEDALERARPQGMRLLVGDACSILRDRATLGDVEAVYLDPMFPSSGKAALPRNEAQILRALIGEQPRDDEAELLTTARGIVTRRVAVKRPPHAPPLAGIKPDHVIRGNKVRYDLYSPRPDAQPSAV